MKISSIQFLVALGMLSAGLVGCAGGSGNSVQLPDPTVRFINGSPNTVGVDFLLNDSIKATNVPFAGASTDFESIDYIKPQDDGYDIGVRATGSTMDLDRFGTVFNRDTHTLIVALGLQDPLLEPDKRLQIFLYGIIRTAPTGTKARVLFIDGFIQSTGSETPNVTFQAAPVTSVDPSPYSNPKYKTEDVSYSSLRSILVDADDYIFRVRRADTQAYVEYATKTITLQAGKVYVALMTGQEGNSDISLRPKIEFIELSTIN